MSELIGSLPFFLPMHHDWSVFVDKLNYFCDVNKLSPERKRAFLILQVTTDAHIMLRDICHPDPVTSKSYEQLIDLCGKYFMHRTTVFGNRRKFYEAKQELEEPLYRWLNRVQELASGCLFGDRFDLSVLDKFIVGLSSTEMITRLCDEGIDTELTLRRAVDVAINMEGISRKTKEDLDVYM